MFTIKRTGTAFARATDEYGEFFVGPTIFYAIPTLSFGAAIGPEDGRVSFCLGGHGRNADDGRMILLSSHNADRANA